MRLTTDGATLAWKLADLASKSLSRSERQAVYVAIGSGDTQAAMVKLLSILAHRQVCVPPPVRLQIQRWLFGYAGSTFGNSLRPIVNDLNFSD